tara:strand:- start:20 stop:280 length:261 start_codon:yes stop_codon:yes gene_type:complete
MVEIKSTECLEKIIINLGNKSREYRTARKRFRRTLEVEYTFKYREKKIIYNIKEIKKKVKTRNRNRIRSDEIRSNDPDPSGWATLG